MISLIVAHDLNHVIGLNNKMPWHYSEDLKHFKRTTLNKDVLVGRNTFESILGYLGKPLPNRTMHVLTRKNELPFHPPVYKSIEEVLETFKNSDKELIVAGGEQIYKQLLPFANTLYITVINKKHEGDSFFPEYDLNDFVITSKHDVEDLTFMTLERKH